MDFFSVEFLLFSLITVAVYYLFKPKYRVKLLFVFSILFWSSQSFFTIAFAIIILFVDLFFIHRLKNNPKILESQRWYLIFLPYIIFLSCFYLLPIESRVLEYGLFDFLTKRSIPGGVLLLSLQSIRNFNLIKTGKLNILEIQFSQWLQMQLMFVNFFAGPVCDYQFFSAELKKEKRFKVGNLISGFKLLFWALLKKIVIADRLAFFMSSYTQGNVVIGGFQDVIFTLIVPFFYITFLIGGYYSLGRSLSYFLDLASLRNIDIYTYLTGVGNFWSRWLLTIKQTTDEIMTNLKSGKFFSYLLVLIINLMIFAKSSLSLISLPLIGLFIYIDFYLQERNYLKNYVILLLSKVASFFILTIFWAIILQANGVSVDIAGQFNSLKYFNNSDFLIFVIILFVVSMHLIRRKLSDLKLKESKEFEDISLVGIVFLGYFVLMFGVF